MCDLYVCIFGIVMRERSARARVAPVFYALVRARGYIFASRSSRSV